METRYKFGAKICRTESHRVNAIFDLKDTSCQYRYCYKVLLQIALCELALRGKDNGPLFLNNRLLFLLFFLFNFRGAKTFSGNAKVI